MAVHVPKWIGMMTSKQLVSVEGVDIVDNHIFTFLSRFGHLPGPGCYSYEVFIYY